METKMMQYVEYMAECDVCMKTVEQRYQVSGYGCCTGLFCIDCKSRLQKCPCCRSDIVIEMPEIDAIKNKMSKYEKLVWFARKPPMDDEDDEFWINLSEGTKQTVHREIEKIISDYPDEVERLCSIENGHWEHGFNSGALAAMRYVITALDKTTSVDEIDGKEYRIGGVTVAEEQFPDLDT